MSVHSRFGGMQDGNKNHGGMWYTRNFESRIYDEITYGRKQDMLYFAGVMLESNDRSHFGKRDENNKSCNSICTMPK